MNKKYFKNNLKSWAKDLFPLNRSITGKYNRETINYLKRKINNNFILKSVRSGTKAFSWQIPKEYSISKGILKDEYGKIICDHKTNNLHVIGYSKSVNKWLKYNELKKHIFKSDKMPKAIPYVTSYYQKNWGFCISKEKFKKLNKKLKYKAEIKSKFFKGEMNYSELIIKGESKKEILICSYICHPALANNELSGILGIALLSKILKKTKYTIRLLLIPETIGATYFIKKNFNKLKKNLIFGINLTCIGIEGPYTLISSISENSYADKIVQRIGRNYKKFKKLSFDFRGSNERQFGCQNLKLPFVTLARKKFGDYKEYHTSADNLSILNYQTIIDTCKFIVKIVEEVNSNKIYTKNNFCEPFLAKKKLIENVATLENMKSINRKKISDFLAYVDESHDLVSLKEKCNIKNISKLAKLLERKKLIKEHI